MGQRTAGDVGEPDVDMNNKVTLPYYHMAEATEWAKIHCPSYITNQPGDYKMRRAPGGWVEVTDIHFLFDNTEEGERDMVLFILRWT
jgi:hypothetical protein